MFNNYDVTSANAEIVMTIPGLYPAGIRVEGFSTDNMISAENVGLAETRMGVDGHMAAGVVNNVIPVTITLEAASDSRRAFETLRDAQRANKKPYFVTMVVNYPSIDLVKTFKGGVLVSAPSMPTGGKTLQPTTWTFHFESVE